MIDQADQRKNCVVIVFKGIFIHTQHIGKRCVYMRHVVVHEGIAQQRSELPMQFLGLRLTGVLPRRHFRVGDRLGDNGRALVGAACRKEGNERII